MKINDGIGWTLDIKPSNIQPGYVYLGIEELRDGVKKGIHLHPPLARSAASEILRLAGGSGGVSWEIFPAHDAEEPDEEEITHYEADIFERQHGFHGGVVWLRGRTFTSLEDAEAYVRCELEDEEDPDVYGRVSITVSDFVTEEVTTTEVTRQEPARPFG